ncbi:Coenzyme F420 hydrogenase/dehydrogenase, beta subunit C-terminal domain [Acinetobacter schindleri]|uniref:Coenzyme F420 hydrogenase/dehydrogenase, beta subunit C-terminal domain n=1 Tax=Acinetobacter schindleri TaxID=108981 RepID=UPI0028D3BC82|nr:Coenzyme F420 hydrogenase/dehydrogenase, beta subunit C-terminal domain [Acinetobacter schindleri]
MSIDDIIQNELCTGCGVCISEDKTKTAKMIWNSSGFLIPELTKNSTRDKMYSVCPFNPNVKNEDALGEALYQKFTENYNEKIGYYNGLYAGYSHKYRETSSSGGIATYIFEKLLNKKIVDHLFIVKEGINGFEYQFFSDIHDIRKVSKTRYMPVTLEKLFQEIENIDGRIAVSGVACFVKAIRLKQENNPKLKDKIPFVVGIVCGGLKSKYYTDFLAQSAGCKDKYKAVQYRVKNKKSYAMDYKFSCTSENNNRIYMVDMQKLGDMWGTGLFKCNACDFCDDVLTELADISLGDAWIPPYNQSGLGTNIVISRSQLAEKLISYGINSKELNLEKILEARIIESQSGSFNHRHNGLLFRLNNLSKNKAFMPTKRKRILEKQNFLHNLIQSKRLITREKSIEYWQAYKSLDEFNESISPLLNNLRFYTKISHKILRVKYIMKKIVGVE